MILGIKDEYLVGKGIVSKIVLPDKEEILKKSQLEEQPNQP